MSTGEAVAHFFGLTGICLIVAGAVGWVLNIVAIANVSEFSGMVVLRAVGVFFAPLGAVLGYI